MVQLTEIFKVIYQHHSCLSGSYVRERIVRGDSESMISDIDILAYYDHIGGLIAEFKEKYVCQVQENDDDEYQANVTIDHFEFDICATESREYYSPPECDVNTLCFDGKEIITWFPQMELESKKYGISMSTSDIIQRCKNKEAVIMFHEFCRIDMEHRISKMRNKGWIF